MYSSDDIILTADSLGHATHIVHRHNIGVSSKPEPDQLALEIPIALEYNGIAHATVLATPQNLHDFAYGFSFTEGVIRSASDIYDIENVKRKNGVVLQLTVASACINQLKLRRRSLAGRTGCGLCGLESLDSVERELPKLPVRESLFSKSAISKAAAALSEQQPLYLKTGATHAAAWASLSGKLLVVREDVGRHNALDKLIGYILRNGYDTSNGFVVLSSRASFELIQKSAAAGISAVVAVSAPTSYAVQMAYNLNVMLAGFARNNDFNIYTHPEFLSS